ncbi:MAG: hypothetical protein LBV80_02560 [Deltaproteobacteria bacterium]|jgi:hypothetical protein|nr:hypothetical protein [Deltaproteobacteria bacterium]
MTETPYEPLAKAHGDTAAHKLSQMAGHFSAAVAQETSTDKPQRSKASNFTISVWNRLEFGMFFYNPLIYLLKQYFLEQLVNI